MVSGTVGATSLAPATNRDNCIVRRWYDPVNISYQPSANALSAVRTYPDHPIVSVGAVILEGERVLLIKRAHEPLMGAWSLPGGVVEVGETLAEALRREVREETGFDIHVGPLIEALDRVHRGPDERVEYHFVILDYLCRVGGGSLSHGSDAAAARWVGMSELGRYQLTEKLTAVISQALEMSRQPI